MFLVLLSFILMFVSIFIQNVFNFGTLGTLVLILLSSLPTAIAFAGHVYVGFNKKFWIQETDYDPIEEIMNGDYYIKDVLGNIIVVCKDDDTGENLALDYNKEIVRFRVGDKAGITVTTSTPVYPSWWKYVRIYDFALEEKEVIIEIPDLKEENLNN